MSEESQEYIEELENLHIKMLKAIKQNNVQ